MDWNALHPYPRYGAAVALAAANRRPDDVDEQELAALVATALDHARARFTVRTTSDPKTASLLTFDWVRASELDPGKDSGQTSANGYYLAPHVTSSDGKAADLARTAVAFRDTLRSGYVLGKPTKLLRSFAPLVAKINAGNASQREPQASFIEAALTALATVTFDKPAAVELVTEQGKTKTIYRSLIPDLPLRDGDQTPLLDFVHLFRRMRDQHMRGEVWTTPPSIKGGFRRPRLHDGNFPEAPRGGALGSAAVVAAIGWWARHANDRPAARHVLNLLAEHPLYVVSYDGTRQERFGHHLVGLALDHDLAALLNALRSTLPVGCERPKGGEKPDPKIALLRMMADRFLRQFTRPALRDFLAVRAEYPDALRPVFDAYFTSPPMNLSPELVTSARAYGAALNYAAYVVARAEVGADERKGAAIRDLDAYKQRALVEFESAVQSAKSGPELLAKVGSRAGRLTGFDLTSDAGLFMEAVASDTISLDDARNLVTAFMRLSTRRPKADTPASPAALPTDAPPVDLFPADHS